MLSPFRSHRPLRLLVAIMVFAFTSLSIGINPARAVYGACGFSEADFLADPGCVRTSVVASTGGLLTRDDLLRNLSLYEHYGFTEQFIRTAPQTTMHVTSDMMWTGCPGGTGSDGLCGLGELGDSQMSGLFPVGMPFTVISDGNAFIALMCGNFHPTDVRIAKDAAKTGFHFVDLPTRIDARVDTPITVGATVANLGPNGPGHFTDEVRLTAPSDCTVTPASHTVPLDLAVNESTTFRRTFTVNCAHPSNHDFTAVDKLVGETGILDPDLTNNAATDSATIEVFDDSDLEVKDARLACADQTTVGTPFACEGTATLTNDGPFGPTPSSATLSVSAPSDCTVTRTSGGSWAGDLAVGAVSQVTGAWEVTCSHRSFHEASLTASLASTYNHAEDNMVANNTMTVADTTEVFESVDLEATFTRVSCTQREGNANDFSCTATLDAANNGPATAVQSQTRFVFTPEAGCTVAAQPTIVKRQLDARETVSESATVDVTCDDLARSVVKVQAVLSNAPEDPHAVDSDTVTAAWGPLDVKPRSLPSSINLGKRGTTPLAILGTNEFNPFTALQQETLRFGVTGTEAVVTCAVEGEDVNADGLLDLVCRVANQAIGAATTSTTTLYLTGALADGTPFYAEDAVNIVR